MKRLVVSLVALLLGVVPAKAQTAPGQPASGASNTVQRTAKLTLIEPWEEVTIRLVIPASAHASGGTENLKAKRAVYGDVRNRFHVLAAEDPHTGKTFISSYFGKGIYVSGPTKVTAFGVSPGGLLNWIESYVEAAGSSGKLDEVIARFETECNGQKLNEKRDKMDPFVGEKDAQGRWYPKGRPDANWIDLARAGPRHFFTGPDAHSGMFFPLIGEAEMANNILRLEIRNPVTQKVANFWIDLEARKVVKCVADDKELDLSIDRSGLAVPPEKESKPAQRGK